MEGDFQVGAWLIQPNLNSISGNGKASRVEPKAMHVLVHLAEHAGDVMPKERIIQAVWADTFVTDDVLTRSISELRKAFHDDPREPRVIQTIPKGGYRLIAPVEWVNGRGALGAPVGGTSPPLRRRWVLAMAGGGLLALAAALLALNIAGLRDRLFPRPAPSPGKIRLVVLPFDNLSGDPEQEYFSDGITEEMTAQLTRLHPERLAVIGRASAMTFKGRKKTISDIGKELRVQYVLEGSVRRAGDRVRVTAQLVEVGDQTHVWAQSYERDLRDILALQSDVAQAIVNEIRLSLTSREQVRMASARPINPAAYEAYLKGGFYINKRSEQTIRKGMEYFELAIKLDPSYAPAYAGLADSYHMLVDYGTGPRNEFISQGKAAVIKALEMDPRLAEAHAFLAVTKSHHEYDWSGGEREFKRAIELSPGSARVHHLYSLALSGMGRTDEALREIKLARELDPLGLGPNFGLAWNLFVARQYDQALVAARNTLELDPRHAQPHHIIGLVYEQKGMVQQAYEELEMAVDLSGGNTEFLGSLGHSYAVGRATGKAQMVLAKFKDLSSQGYATSFGIALIYTAMGDKDQAFAWLDKAYEDRVYWLSFVKVDPRFDPLRSDPRFQDLLRRMNFPP